MGGVSQPRRRGKAVPVRSVSRAFAPSVLAVVLAGGCASSSGHKNGASSGEKAAVRQLRVPAYGPYPPTTIPIAAGTSAQCRADAAAFTSAAFSFVAPATLATRLEADEYYFRARLQFFAFRAHLCDTAILRKAVSRRLTARQRQYLAGRFTFLGQVGRELTGARRN